MNTNDQDCVVWLAYQGSRMAMSFGACFGARSRGTQQVSVSKALCFGCDSSVHRKTFCTAIFNQVKIPKSFSSSVHFKTISLLI